MYSLLYATILSQSKKQLEGEDESHSRGMLACAREKIEESEVLLLLELGLCYGADKWAMNLGYQTGTYTHTHII